MFKLKIYGKCVCYYIMPALYISGGGVGCLSQLLAEICVVVLAHAYGTEVQKCQMLSAFYY